jgi:hypothetical protein
MREFTLSMISFNRLLMSLVRVKVQDTPLYSLLPRLRILFKRSFRLVWLFQTYGVRLDPRGELIHDLSPHLTSLLSPDRVKSIGFFKNLV